MKFKQCMFGKKINKVSEDLLMLVTKGERGEDTQWKTTSVLKKPQRITYTPMMT